MVVDQIRVALLEIVRQSKHIRVSIWERVLLGAPAFHPSWMDSELLALVTVGI